MRPEIGRIHPRIGDTDAALGVDKVAIAHVNADMVNEKETFEENQIAGLEISLGYIFAVMGHCSGVAGKMNLQRIEKNFLDEAGTIHAGMALAAEAVGCAEVGFGCASYFPPAPRRG